MYLKVDKLILILCFASIQCQCPNLNTWCVAIGEVWHFFPARLSLIYCIMFDVEGNAFFTNHITVTMEHFWITTHFECNLWHAVELFYVVFLIGRLLLSSSRSRSRRTRNTITRSEIWPLAVLCIIVFCYLQRQISPR